MGKDHEKFGANVMSGKTLQYTYSANFSMEHDGMVLPCVYSLHRNSHGADPIGNTVSLLLRLFAEPLLSNESTCHMAPSLRRGTLNVPLVSHVHIRKQKKQHKI